MCGYGVLLCFTVFTIVIVLFSCSASVRAENADSGYKALFRFFW